MGFWMSDIGRRCTAVAFVFAIGCSRAPRAPIGVSDDRLIAMVQADDVAAVRAAAGEAFTTRIVSGEERADLLTIAALVDAPLVVSALLAAGADVNGRPDPFHRLENAWGHTPLYAASHNGHAAIVKTLLDAGADTTRPDAAGFGPLHVAAAAGHTPVVALLVEEGGVPIDSPSVRGDTALMLAVMRRKPDTVSYLLSHHADPRVANRRGDTPLHEAVRNGDAAPLIQLLAAGARVDARDRNGRTPPDDARLRAPDLVRVLRSGSGAPAEK